MLQRTPAEIAGPEPSNSDGVEVVRFRPFAPPGSPLDRYTSSVSTAESRFSSAALEFTKVAESRQNSPRETPILNLGSNLVGAALSDYLQGVDWSRRIDPYDFLVDDAADGAQFQDSAAGFRLPG